MPSSLPFPHSSPRRGRRRASAITALAAAVLLPTGLLSTAPVAAAEDGKQSGRPTPPARMSTVGGERLGRPGTQVELRTGAPALPKKLTSRAWIVADAENGEVLAAHNAHWKLPPASTLKMLFADLLLPKFPKDRTYTVRRSDLQGMGPGSSLVGIKEEQSYTVEQLWLGVFLRSGNDAVHTLAAMNGGKEKTIREMNEHARKLQALDTRVVSPDGYDAEGQVSSAYDLTLIARHGLQKPDFRQYASTVRAQFPGEEPKKSKNGKQKKRPTFEIQNTNRLLTGDTGLDPYRGAAGVKNGYTTEAGYTLTGVAERDGRVLLVTALHPKAGANRIYQETAALFDWGFAAAGQVEPVGELVRPAEPSGAASAGRDGLDVKGMANGTADEPGSDGTPVAPERAGRPQGGAGTALSVTAVALAVLGLAALAVHRRWPQHRRSGRPGG